MSTSCCPVPQIYQPIIRDCKTGEFREAQEGESLLVDGDYVPALVLTEDLELYIDPDGSDSTGTGTSDNPWYSPHKALEEIARIIPGNYEININVGAGKYVFDKTIRPGYGYGAKVNFIATRTNMSTSLTVSNLDTTQSTDANFTELQYFDFDVSLAGEAAYTPFVGQLARINNVGGATPVNPDTMRGLVEVIDWNSGTEVVTFRVWQREDVTEIASGVTSVTTLNFLDSLFTWDEALDDHAYEVNGLHGCNWSWCVFRGNQNQFDARRGIRVRDGGIFRAENPIAIFNFDVGFEVFNGSFCEGSACMISKIWTVGMIVQGAVHRFAFGGFCTGCGQQGIWCQNGGVCIGFDSIFIACSAAFCVLCETNADCTLTDAFFYYEDSGTSPGASYCFRAEQFGRIETTGTTLTGFTAGKQRNAITQGLIEPSTPL